jgi:hypothetical protein
MPSWDQFGKGHNLEMFLNLEMWCLNAWMLECKTHSKFGCKVFLPKNHCGAVMKLSQTNQFQWKISWKLLMNRPPNWIDTSAPSNFFKLFWAYLIHIFDASSSDISLNFDLKITILWYQVSNLGHLGADLSILRCKKTLHGGQVVVANLGAVPNLWDILH